MLVSLIAAIVAALLYGIAAVMQAIAVRAASNKPAQDASGGVDPGLVVRLLGQWRFVVSMCLDMLGFVAHNPGSTSAPARGFVANIGAA